MSQTQQGTFRSKKLTGKISPNQSLLSQLNMQFTTGTTDTAFIDPQQL